MSSYVNTNNTHNSGFPFSSKVGPVAGCGASGSVDSLQQKGLYNVINGGKKHSKKTNKNRSMRIRRKSHKKKRKSHGKRKSRQRGGQYLSNVANSHIYSTGAPPLLSPKSSALANPPPFKPSNDCLNTWKHLGDRPPYNKVYQ